MAIGLSNAFVTLFDAEVKQAYQGKAKLVGAVRQRRGVEGSVVKFPKVQSGEKQSEYIQRCLEAIGSEYPDKDQAVAVCYTQWKEGK